jgi:hypothetical protein
MEEAPDPKMAEDMNEKEEEKKNDDHVAPMKSDETAASSSAISLWSEILATPATGDKFSPARPLDDNDCLFGFGKLLFVCQFVGLAS